MQASDAPPPTRHCPRQAMVTARVAGLLTMAPGERRWRNVTVCLRWLSKTKSRSMGVVLFSDIICTRSILKIEK